MQGHVLPWHGALKMINKTFKPGEDNNLLQPPRILVIDGEKTIRRSIAAMLTTEGYVTETVETGKEAIEKSKSSFYNLVITDVKLPDMLGTEAISQMKETVPPMIKIIISGHATLPQAVDAVNDGADACILIPTQPEKLLNVIRKGLKKQEEARKYGEQRIADFIDTRVNELFSPNNQTKQYEQTA